MTNISGTFSTLSTPPNNSVNIIILEVFIGRKFAPLNRRCLWESPKQSLNHILPKRRSRTKGGVVLYRCSRSRGWCLVICLESPTAHKTFASGGRIIIINAHLCAFKYSHHVCEQIKCQNEFQRTRVRVEDKPIKIHACQQ